MIIGGSFQSYAMISTADIVAVFDALQEIEQIPDRSNLIKVPLGSPSASRNRHRCMTSSSAYSSIGMLSDDRCNENERHLHD
jgi:hypothetical protein